MFKPCLRWQIGLIDEGETAEQAAIRELHEETGYKAESILHASPVIASDPGILLVWFIDFWFKFRLAGMTNANMKLVVLSVVLDDKMETPAAQLEAGEFIVTKVVELAKLKAELESKTFFPQINWCVLTHGYSSGYDRKVWISIFSLYIGFIHFLTGIHGGCSALVLCIWLWLGAQCKLRIN